MGELNLSTAKNVELEVLDKAVVKEIHYSYAVVEPNNNVQT